MLQYVAIVNKKLFSRVKCYILNSVFSMSSMTHTGGTSFHCKESDESKLKTFTTAVMSECSVQPQMIPANDAVHTTIYDFSVMEFFRMRISLVSQWAGV